MESPVPPTQLTKSYEPRSVLYNGKAPSLPRRITCVHSRNIFYPDAGRYVCLGTDGFVRSDYRKALRKFFEVDRHYVVVAALKALADEGAIKGRRYPKRSRRYGHYVNATPLESVKMGSNRNTSQRLATDGSREREWVRSGKSQFRTSVTSTLRSDY